MQLLTMATQLHCFSSVVLVFFAVPSFSKGNCIFCNDNVTYDFSSLSTDTFTAHNGIKGSRNHSTAWNTYFVTSPCASVTTDSCIAGPTADPVAIRPAGDPVCKGLGSLSSVGNKPPELTPAGSMGVNITLHGQGACPVVYRMLCDRTAPSSNPPEPTIIYRHKSGKGCAYVVTWKHASACDSKPTPAGACTQPAPPAPPEPVCEACVPRWNPTWNMSRSTILYTCNASAMHSVDEAVRYGVVVYDWSNAKHLWVNAQPMNDEELLTKQAEMVLAVDPGVAGEQPRVWVYRNKIKALNWYSSVRKKLDDPRFAGYFVKFRDYKGRSSNNSYHVPACDFYGTKESPPKCSGFYHDQTQSPTRLGAGKQFSPGAAYCNPACFHDAKGHKKNVSCINTCEAQCDCGTVNPCGEYTFDHRNASFSDWWINEYMISNHTLLHKPMINLGWLDDGIGLNGMSEASPGWVADTGSTPEQMQDHVDAFSANIGKLQRRVVDLGGFYWQMIRGAGPQVAPVPVDATHQHCHKPHPRNVTTAQCKETLRTWCSDASPATRVAQRYLQCPLAMQDPALAESATAEFLLSRGPFAWIGYGWTGCAEEARYRGTYLYPFGLPEFPRPQLWDEDFGGEALETCWEQGVDSGVFMRRYPNATVKWDCNTGQGHIDRRFFNSDKSY